MSLEGIPNKIIPGVEAKEVTSIKSEKIISLLEGDFLNDDPEKRPTILDVHWLGPEAKLEDFPKWIKNEIGIEEKLIKDDRKTLESRRAYNLLDQAYQRGKTFLKNTLKYSDKELDIGPSAILNKEDVENLLKETVTVKGSKGLSKSVLYCRLVKSTIVAYETLKHDAYLLKEITDEFEKKMIHPISTDNSTDGSPLVLTEENNEGKKFYVAEKENLKGGVVSRAKELEKAMLRFITRPESDAQVALKDGIASRITIEKNQAMELVPILCKWLAENKNMNVRPIRVENKSFFTEGQMKNLEERLYKNFSPNNLKFVEGRSSSTSMGDFVGVAIKGQLDKDSVVTSVSKHARQFEIQLVSPDNENEKGRNHHSVYDVVKFITARTRLDGGCPENIFNEFVKDASRESGMSEKEINGYLLDSYKGKEPPVVKMKKNNNKHSENIYVSHNVYSRWNEFDWVDVSLVSDINKAKK